MPATILELPTHIPSSPGPSQPTVDPPGRSDALQDVHSAAPAPTSPSVNPPGSPAPAVLPSPEPAPILTIEELAAYLRLNHKTIRDAIGRGDIPGVRRIGGAVRIHRDTVVGWLASGQGRVVNSRRTR
jgi:excisionase family DNA binding protein